LPTDATVIDLCERASELGYGRFLSWDDFHKYVMSNITDDMKTTRDRRIEANIMLGELAQKHGVLMAAIEEDGTFHFKWPNGRAERAFHTDPEVKEILETY
jgi:hypothetical protein